MRINKNEKIAVLLTCFNRKDKTIACLRSLFDQTNSLFEFNLQVFLVDDGSNDGTEDAVREFFPQVNLIKGSGSLYWNRGMHLGWQTALKSGSFDYFLWLNDDAVLFNNAIEELLFCIDNSDVASCVCGALCSLNDGQFTYGGYNINGKPVIPDGSIQSCEIINGNCVLVNYMAYQVVGNLDTKFHHAIGDHDYGLRLLKNNGTVVTTRKYVASCERNLLLPKWCYAETPIIERFKALYSPLGYSQPVFFFHYELRHFGVITAVKHFLSIHLRALIPSLWK